MMFKRVCDSGVCFVTFDTTLIGRHGLNGIASQCLTQWPKFAK